ncbi:unnamed protein product [Notodromas monacha]|uniref:Lipocalin/cytosolic fatty-acid binding domain-containing protein n=1 Tax=Notodromas monacha TaxID=399045 RepID=A0A7R9BNX7_9CRUS|nr:unnamed protein product [Notodromas monacha]CAG0917470.1 unnamed protein product [Notodromas monacha]
MLAVFLAICYLLSVVHGGTNTVTFGPCVKPSVKTDLNITEYAGLWYEYERFPVSFEDGLSCVQAHYARLDDQFGRFRLNVTNAGIKNNAPDVIVGTAIQSWQPGVLKVKFQGAPVYGTYKVLDTDYTSYASVYSCINFFLFKIEFAWVLTRETIPTPEISAMAEKVFTDRNINTGLFVKTVQGKQYYPFAQVGIINAGTVGLEDTPRVINGTASETFDDGVLAVSFQNVPRTGEYRVLETDYKNFACIYSCIDVFFLLRIEFAWILARRNKLSPEMLARAQRVLASNNVDPAILVDTVQNGDCNYVLHP